MDILIPFLIILLLILLNGLFVAAEFAIIGVRPSRVEQLAQEGNRTAIAIRNTLREPGKQDRYIATAQLGITLASLGLGMYGEPAIAHLLEGPLHDWFGLEGAIVHTISFIVALTFMTYLHVVIGEMVPKSIALQAAERTVIVLATPMALMQRLFSVVITILNKIGLLVL
ncbi:MAG TPA: CNNM domain-containing protein, partial [Ardenticatenaceae bacterium]